MFTGGVRCDLKVDRDVKKKGTLKGQKHAVPWWMDGWVDGRLGEQDSKINAGSEGTPAKAYTSYVCLVPASIIILWPEQISFHMSNTENTFMIPSSCYQLRSTFTRKNLSNKRCFHTLMPVTSSGH